MARRRRRGIKRRRKLTTVRSVKRLIANFIPSKRATFTSMNSGFVYGGFSQRGFGVVPINVGGSWLTAGPAGGPLKTEFNSMHELAENCNPTLRTASTNAFNRFTWKNMWKEFLFHNPVTEGEFVTVWIFKYVGSDFTFDANVQPWKHTTVPYNVSTWPTGTLDTVSASADEALGVLQDWIKYYLLIDDETVSTSGTLTVFGANMMAYPSQIPNLKDRWVLRKKVKFFLSPGQTKRWRVDLGSGSFDQDEHNGFPVTDTAHAHWYQKISQCMLMMTEGIPTHQNDGVSPATNILTSVSTCATGMEWTSKGAVDVGISSRQNTAKCWTNVTDKQSINAAKSLIPEVEGNVRSV